VILLQHGVCKGQVVAHIAGAGTCWLPIKGVDKCSRIVGWVSLVRELLVRKH
jgi:hypothetical protein